MGNAQSSLPFNAQSTYLQTALSCDVGNNTGIILPTSDLILTTTAPLFGGSGYNVSFSDFQGSFAIPFNSSFPATQFSNNYAVEWFMDFTVSNAVPSVLTVYNLDHVYVPRARAGVPRNDRSLGLLGPVTLGQAGMISDLAVTEIRMRFVLLDSNGFPGANAVSYNTICRPVKEAPISVAYEAILSSTAIDSSTGDNAPFTGVTGSFPASNGSVKSVKANIPIFCNAARGLSISNQYNLSIEATGPSALINGQSFSLVNVDSFVTVPGDILAGLSSFFGGTTAAGFVDLGQAFSGAGISGPGLGAVLDNASPSSFDIAKDFTVASDPNTARPLFTGRYFPVGDNTPIVFPLPNFGTLEFDNLTAGAVGATFGLEVSRLQALVSVSSSRGEFDGADKIDCFITHPYSLLRAPILAA